MQRMLATAISWLLVGASLTYAPFCLLLSAIGFAGKLADADLAFNRQAAIGLVLEAGAIFLVTVGWFYWGLPRFEDSQEGTPRPDYLPNDRIRNMLRSIAPKKISGAKRMK